MSQCMFKRNQALLNSSYGIIYIKKIQENVITVVAKRKTLLSMPMAVQNACLKNKEGDVWG